MKKELSGFLLSSEKWSASLGQLAQPTCEVTHLRLFHNTPNQTVQVLSVLQHNSSVTELSIGELELTGAAALKSYLSSCSPRVQTLTIQQVHDAENSLQHLSEGLKNNSTVIDLQLTGVNTYAGLTPVALCLTARTIPLQHLRLRRTKVSPEVAAVLATGAGPHLQTLEIGEVCFSEESLHALLSSNASHAPTFPRLQSLHLGSTSLRHSAAQVLTSFLSTSTSLTSLSLQGNTGLGDEGAACLGRSLPRSSSLQQLDLSSCGIRAAGAAALAAGISGSRSLTQLCLSSNAIEAAGCAALLSALQVPSMCPMQSLQLDMNSIRGLDLQAELATAQPHVTAPLQSLCMARNPLGEAGLRAVLQALEPQGPALRTLQQLDVADASINDAGVDVLVPFLATNPQLCKLHINNNCIHDRGGSALLAAVQSHSSLNVFSVEDNRLSDPHLRTQLAALSRRVGGRMSMDLDAKPSGPALSHMVPARPSCSSEGGYGGSDVHHNHDPCYSAPGQHIAKHRLERGPVDSEEEPAAKCAHHASVACHQHAMPAAAKPVQPRGSESPIKEIHTTDWPSRELTSRGSCATSENSHSIGSPKSSATAYIMMAGPGCGRGPTPCAPFANRENIASYAPMQVDSVRGTACGSTAACAGHRCSSSSVLSSPGSYRRFYKPLTPEQQALFVDF